MSLTSQMRVGLAPLEGNPTNSNQAALGLTAVLVASPSNPSGRARWRAVLITNLHASNLVAWTTVDAGAAAPTLTADAGANGGAIVLPGTQQLIGIMPGEDLYVVASAVSTPVNIQSWLLS
jgi:hypothetical protein